MQTRGLAFAARVALPVPVLALGGAYIGQYVFGLFPCEMCWWQRYAHFAALALALAALVVRGPARRMLVWLAGGAIAVAALIGGYHAGVEYGWWPGITHCTSQISFTAGQNPMDAIMAQPLIRCDVAQWQLFGISLAGFDFILSGLGAALIFRALLARGRR